MATKEQISAPSGPSFDTVMGALLALLLVGGLLAALYVHQAMRSFVQESQLPIFPSTASAAGDLPPLPDNAPVPAAPSSGVAAGPSAPGDTPPASEGDTGSESEPDSSGPLTVPPEDYEELDAPPAATERLTVLLMGIDRRSAESAEDGPWRTDSMILLSIDPKAQTVSMLSVPRDLYITIPDYGYGEHRDRINTAYYWGDFYEYPGGGAALAKQAIRRNFGIEVDRYLVMDFNGFREMIDYVGGHRDRRAGAARGLRVPHRRLWDHDSSL